MRLTTYARVCTQGCKLACLLLHGCCEAARTAFTKFVEERDRSAANSRDASVRASQGWGNLAVR